MTSSVCRAPRRPAQGRVSQQALRAAAPARPRAVRPAANQGDLRGAHENTACRAALDGLPSQKHGRRSVCAREMGYTWGGPAGKQTQRQNPAAAAPPPSVANERHGVPGRRRRGRARYRPNDTAAPAGASAAPPSAAAEPSCASSAT